jgi:hypothetical protein
MIFAEVVEDSNWLEPEELYFARGAILQGEELERPIYQGDVFVEVMLPSLPKQPVQSRNTTLDFSPTTVMVLPHPCQCYYGDKLRPQITVAPVSIVENYDNFGPMRDGLKDRFALPRLHIGDQTDWKSSDCAAHFGKLISVPNRWLLPSQRVACLSHKGIGLLAKRVLGFQLRDKSTTLTFAMAQTQDEWNESFLMQAWVKQYGNLRGFTDWMRTPKVIEGLGRGLAVIPADYRTGALDALLAAITGTEIKEPE